MHLPKRDLIATGLVTVAGMLYLLWATGAAPAAMSGTRATGIAVLALGFAASASAVVPSFGQLLHGDKVYLGVTSLIGLAAAGAGVQVLVTESDAGLGVVIAAMVVLWLMATMHHRSLAENATPRPVRDSRHAAGRRPQSAGTR